jgi:membrane-bound lytic murein transglycosylase A
LAAGGGAQRVKRLFGLAVVALLAACSTAPSPPSPPAEPPAAVGIDVPQGPGPALTQIGYEQLPGWAADHHAAAIPAFLAGCARMVGQNLGGAGEAALRGGSSPSWRASCTAAATVPAGNDRAARAFFERYFQPWLASIDGSAQGKFTGYYEPELKGARQRGGIYQTPLLRRPGPGRSLSRAQIVAGGLAHQRLELLYVSDPIDAFFLQIQGAGRVRMPDGRDIRVSYDGQNGQAYIPIGRILVDRREMKLEDVTLQSIRAWLIAHPKQAPALMNMNPSYVFFREIPGTAPEQGPPGALGAPLTPLRSIAVDKSFIPMGAPVWIETTDPVTAAPIRQIMMAQDVGGAIKGAIRADIFFGWGAAAEERAGRMNKPGAVYIFLPRYANIPMASNSK